MANNKDKIRASAQKFLQKGQIDKAIREYQRLVEEDPKDVRTLLKIGDLQTRIGANSEATTTYGLVAQFYSEQGFFLKAVAVYKQILKLDPNLIEVNLKLADLYHQLGLTSDAANQYRQISQLYEQSGRVEDSIKVLQKMVELDPENVASRIKLAEVYAKQNMLEDARGEFTKAAQFLKSHHRVDDYVKVAERIIHFDPNDLRTTKELANIYIQKGDARRALAKLQICFKANPKDIETLNLLAAAFKDLEQPQKTISVYREIARIHEAAGDTPSFQSVMRRILAIDPDDAEARKALGAGDRPPPPIRQSTPGGPTTPPPRRTGLDTNPEAAPALAMPTRRVTGELSPAQVDAVQQQVNTRRATGDISPAQIAAMEAIAAQGAARRGTNEVSPAQVAAARAIATQPTPARRGTGEVSPAQLAQTSPLPDNALGRIVPAQKAVQAKSESPVQEIDRRAPSPEEHDEIEVDTDFDEPEVETVTEVEDAPPADGLSDNTRETVSRILVEAEVYIKYGLKQKAVDHLRKIFVLAPDHREARARYKTLLIDTNGIDEAVEVLLGMAAVAVEQGDNEAARGDLVELLELAPEHRRARDLLAKLGPVAGKSTTSKLDLPELTDDDDELVVTDDMVDDDYVPSVATPREASVVSLSYEPSEKAAEIDLDADDDTEVVGMELEAETDDAYLGASASQLDDPMMAGLEGATPAVDDDDDGITVELDDAEAPELELQPTSDVGAMTFADSPPPPALDLPPMTDDTDDEIGVELDTSSLDEGLALDGPLPDEPSLEADGPGATFELDAETEAAFDLDDDPVETTQVTAAPLPPEPVVPPVAAKPEPAKPQPVTPAPEPVVATPAAPVAPAAPPVAAKPKVAARPAASLDDDLDALINSAVPSRAKADPAKAAADKAKAEAAKAEAAKAEAAKAEAAKAEAAKAEAAKAEAAKAEAAKADAARQEAARAEAARAEAARAEAARAEAARVDAAKAEAAKAEAAAAERRAAERLEAERAEAARVAAAAAREEAARAEAARIEAAREEAARAEIARAEAEAERAVAAAAARAEPHPAAAAKPDVEQADLSGEIAEVGFYLEQGLEDEARDTLANLLRDHPTHSELLALEAKLNGTGAPALPTAPALDYEPEPEMLIGGDLGLDIAADLQSAAADDDLQVSLDDVFDAFKKGVADTVEEADYATHYDLGIAYKEMELLSDAIREFELAAKDPTRAIGALTMMGLCSLQSGDTENALTYFQRGLNSTSVTSQEAMALRYEIGVAYEGAGRFGEASKFFEKVHTWDASFRDVEERLSRAKDQDEGGDVTSELDDLLTETEAERASRSKISYV